MPQQYLTFIYGQIKSLFSSPVIWVRSPRQKKNKKIKSRKKNCQTLPLDTRPLQAPTSLKTSFHKH